MRSEIVTVTGIPLVDIAQAYLKECSMAKIHTFKAKRNDLNKLFSFLSSIADIETLTIQDMNVGNLSAFCEHVAKTDKAPATASRRVASVRSFCNYISEFVPSFRNPASKLKGPKCNPGGFRGIDIDTASKIEEAAYRIGRNKFLRARNGMSVSIINHTGLRADEVLNLTEAQISEDGCWFSNVKCKADIVRNVYIPSHLRELLADYLLIRREVLFGQFRIIDTRPYPLLVSLRDSFKDKPESFKVSYETLHRTFQVACQIVHIKPISPHTLRHSFAHELMRSTKDVRLVAQALGHTDIKTTMRYTSSSEEALAAAIEGVKKK